MGCMHVLGLFSIQIILLLALAAETTAKVPAIIVFGDSSVDAGNNNVISTFLKSNFKPYGRDFEGGLPTGRFCNGRIPPDFISEAFGLKPAVPAYLDPLYSISDFATGVCFASAGTGYDNATSSVLSVIPLWKQMLFYKAYQMKLRAYLGEIQANQIINEGIHMISIGTNDFLENYYAFPGGRRSTQYTISEYENFLAGIAENFVRDLYGLGARKISLGGLPPMGCMPLERNTNLMGGRECVQSYNNVAMEFNGKLRKMVTRLNKELPGINLMFSNPYFIFMQIIRRPSLFGFEVTSMACCATGMYEMGYACAQNSLLTCTDADKYVFWDSFHPTQKTNQIVANYVVKRVLYKLI
uniref:GDSL-motif lipase/hydrolase family protein n=1 Tax=Populus alba TaxID=43335 RepID=A0A4U5R3Y1_POPAL|nr:GDSL-motif lipase/hydrolase family protein [Populus alba]